jgi:DNA-binding transcriptional LysR family regulator
MELRQLRYFMAVAQELHFGRAAASLHMSQPPLSLQISRLERELGVKLFERTTRHVQLTAAGKRFQDRVASILEDLDDSVDELSEFADGYAGTLAVGFVSSANYTVLPGVVPLFRESRPKVALNLAPLTSGEQRTELLRGKLDVAIIRDEVEDDSSEIVTEVVYAERLVACLPITHPLAQRKRVSARDISRVPMISYPREKMTGFVDRVALALGPYAGQANTVQEVVHQETALGFVAAGVGTSILPESIRHLVPASIAVVPLEGDPTTRLLAATLKNPRQPAADRAFIDCLHRAAAGLGDAGPADGGVLAPRLAG